MKKGWIAAGVAAALQGFLLLAAGVIFAALFLIKILWAWTIPDLFPGAVEQGLIAGVISWFASLTFSLALFLGILRDCRQRKPGHNGFALDGSVELKFDDRSYYRAYDHNYRVAYEEGFTYLGDGDLRRELLSVLRECSEASRIRRRMPGYWTWDAGTARSESSWPGWDIGTWALTSRRPLSNARDSGLPKLALMRDSR